MSSLIGGNQILLSACMIMKDEAENIERCLRSLQGVVDEIVIYDTGSTDDSVELARALGARVIEGEWRDDFAIARNAARAECRGRWLLHIDLDESIEDTDAAVAIRPVLAKDRANDAIEVALFNLGGTELAPERLPVAHWVPRLARRRTTMWRNALHETISPRTPGAPLRLGRTDHLTLLHRGYLHEIFTRRQKAERNERIAQNRTDDVNTTRQQFELARAKTLSGATDEALAAFEVVAGQTDEPGIRRVAAEMAATTLLDAGRVREAERWIERRAEFPELPGVLQWLRARAASVEGRHEDVLRELTGIVDYTDRYSLKGPASVHLMRFLALAGLDRDVEATLELEAVFADQPLYDAAWAALLGDLDRWRDALPAAARAVPADGLKLLAGRLAAFAPDLAGAVAEALWTCHEGSPVLLALAATIAPQLSALEDTARWAMRLRAAGLTASCPLRALANDATAPRLLRLQAAYLGGELFGDQELRSIQDELAAVMAGA